MKLKSLDHFVMNVSDIDKTLKFYVDILGMEKRVTNGRIALFFGEQKINLHKYLGEFQPAAINSSCGAMDLCFETDENIDNILKNLKDKGVETILGPCKRNGAKGPMNSVYIRDPDQNLVELCTYKK